MPPGTAAARRGGGAGGGVRPPPTRPPDATGRGSPPGRAGPAPGRPPPRRAVPAKILVRIDWDTLMRGYPVAGEVCEIAGVGPVAVSAVEAMIASGDAFLAAVVTKGVDVVNVAHMGRRPSAAQRSGWEWKHPVCVVEGCNNCRRLEADHRVPWAEDKVTLLSNMDGLCEYHHDLKTHKAWALVEGVGKRPMVPPDDPRHPANVRRARAGVAG